jgi:heme exporter protein A
LLKLSAIEASDIACVRGGRRLFSGLSFAVRAGECLSVEGPNGAGKTSLLRLLAGFLAPDAGVVRFKGETDVTEGEERGAFVGWFGHQDAAKPQLTVAELLRFFSNLYGVGADIAQALSDAGLAKLADLPCQYLSAGQKKRLALARLAICERPLWLLDEPFASLDAAGKRMAAAHIAGHCAKGGIVIAATHEPLGVTSSALRLGTP